MNPYREPAGVAESPRELKELDMVRVTNPGPYYSGPHLGCRGQIAIGPKGPDKLFLVSFATRGCGFFYASELTAEPSGGADGEKR